MLKLTKLICSVTFTGSSLLACSLFNSNDFDRPSLVGQRIPNTRFTSLQDGFLRTLEEFSGAPRVIIFWAEWCSYSKPVILEINKIAREFKGSGDPIKKALNFVAISIDPADRYQRVQERVTYQKLDALTHAFSGNGLFDETYMAYRGGNLPHIIFVGADGVVLAEGHGSSVIQSGLSALGVN
jgi:thiol-disulfide isomerase/thioredoxin